MLLFFSKRIMSEWVLAPWITIQKLSSVEWELTLLSVYKRSFIYICYIYRIQTEIEQTAGNTCLSFLKGCPISPQQNACFCHRNSTQATLVKSLRQGHVRYWRLATGSCLISTRCSIKCTHKAAQSSDPYIMSMPLAVMPK